MKLTKPFTKYDDTTIRHHHNDTTIRHVHSRSLYCHTRRHPKNFEVVSQPVSLGSDISLNVNGPSCYCLLVRWTWQLYNFGKVNTKVLTGQTVLRNRWRDHRCHYGQLSWYWDEEWVTCRWSMICASSWLQSWNDDTSNSLLESTTSQSVLMRRFVHPCQSWPVLARVGNLWSWPSPSRNMTTPPSDTTTTIPQSDMYIPGRYIATPGDTRKTLRSYRSPLVLEVI